MANITRERHNDRGGPSSDTAESRELESAGNSLRRQPEDHCQIEEAIIGQRSVNWAESPTLDRFVDRGGGDHRRLPKKYTAATRRLSLHLCG
jgi:hypothetical protein